MHGPYGLCTARPMGSEGFPECHRLAPTENMSNLGVHPMVPPPLARISVNIKGRGPNPSHPAMHVAKEPCHAIDRREWRGHEKCWTIGERPGPHGKGAPGLFVACQMVVEILGQ